MQVNINPQDMPGLAILIGDTGVDMFTHQLMFAADGTLTVPDAIAGQVQQILDAPDWRQRAFRRALVAYADETRKRMEGIGIIVDGNKIATDERRAQLLLLEASSAGEIRFQSADRKWLRVDANQFRKIVVAIADHLQHCCVVQEQVDVMIGHGQITKPEQIDEWFSKELR